MQYRRSSSAAWPTLAVVIVGVLFAGALAYHREPPPTVPPAPVLLAGPHAPRCPSCGWIEAKRELAPLIGDSHALRTFEYTVRMRDGSTHVFQEVLPASWRVGEPIMLIEATGALD